MEKYKRLANFLRYWALYMSTNAGSGHPTSSLSAADLMAVFISEVFRFDFDSPQNPSNDRLIFSKGHATPLYYALFAAAGAIKVAELLTYRQFGSRLEGHPTPSFPFVEAATGSLGQGLSIGLGMALALKAKFLNKKNPQLTTHNPQFPRVFVLLGDGEFAEGNVWEAVEVASKYKLANLTGILDVNRLGQSEETMLGHNVATYQKRIASFGWATKVIKGHDFPSIIAAYNQIGKFKDRPYMIIAKTIKGKGVSFLEDKNGWHGKALKEEEFEKAVKELGKVDLSIRVEVRKPFVFPLSSSVSLKSLKLQYQKGEEIATRKAYGEALARIGKMYPNIVALDGDVKNSTFSEIFKEKFPDRFYEMYIAEQNMVGAAVGFAKMGFIPFVSTFACFLTRAFDQIRMAAITGANIKFSGSHAGVSIGEDGPSQMGLEDLAMFRAIYNSVVLYPAEAVATEKLVEEMAKHKGIAYLRTTRPKTPVIYDNREEFPIGGSKIHKLLKSLKSPKQKIILIAAGITLFEALKAQEELAKEEIEAIVVDCYSVKPIDEKRLKSLIYPTTDNLQPTTNIITVEDHYFEGGLGDAVLNVFANSPNYPNLPKIYKLAVTKMPRSGKPEQLLDYEGISATRIIKKVKATL